MDIFGKENIDKIKELEADVKRLKESLNYSNESIRDSDKNHELYILGLNSEHSIALREKDFELKHFKDEELNKVREERVDLSKRFAVLEMENQLLKEVTDVNSDIIDVKDLVTKLIDKMPSLDLNNLTVNTTTTNKE